MNSTATSIPYADTGFFSAMLLDYISQDNKLLPFYTHPVSITGIKSAIHCRKFFNTDRAFLLSILKQQYQGISLQQKQQQNIELLDSENTFTVCTAHQPNIFTGHLYFIYKILHAVKLAEKLKMDIPENDFVPVYYMGSEDADLDELGHIFINGEKYEWKTNQKGAVGRMKVDKALIQLIDLFHGQLAVLPYGNEIVDLMQQCYTEGATIEQATFKLVNTLFASYGLLILLPDNANLKAAFIPVIERELMESFSAKEVKETISIFPVEYKAQASGREINMFYLSEGSRDRIERVGDEWVIVNKGKVFTKAEIVKELHQYPERFSPNVILRPVLQELILPNIAFIGGGGEIAYWLELKKVFEAAGVLYPMLILRNSFLLVESKDALLIKKLQFSQHEIFKPAVDLMNMLVKRDSRMQVSLENEKLQLEELYKHIKIITGKIDKTLPQHTEALLAKALKRMESLEKKMLRAEKMKFDAQQQQLQKLKKHLFPGNSLQERVENFMLYYAKWGNSFIQTIYENSLSLEQEFTILVEK